MTVFSPQIYLVIFVTNMSSVFDGHLGLQLCQGWSLLRMPSATQVMYEIWLLLGNDRFNFVALK